MTFRDIGAQSTVRNCSSNMSEIICIQWSDFQENIKNAFGNLRKNNDFTDVTLVCEDGNQVEAHKVILAASSPFFMEILKRNKHPHPLIYMKGLKSEDLVAIVDFLYFGEANVFQENLDSFLSVAEELRLEGLTGNAITEEVEEQKSKAEPARYFSKKRVKAQGNRTPSNVEHQMQPNSDSAVAVQENQISIGLQDLDDKIRSMMTITDVRSADGKGYMASCNICGKQGPSRNMPTHIEGNHITGVSHTCDICGKASRSRKARRQHRIKKHNNILQD